MKERRTTQKGRSPAEQVVETWLRTEAVDDESASEEALRQMFDRLPRFAPGADFAARITALALGAEAQITAGAVSRPLLGVDRQRWWIAASLVIFGVLVTLGLPIWLFLFRTLPPGRWLSAPIQVLASIFEKLQFLAQSLAVLGDLWRAALTVLTSWPVALAGTLLLVLSITSWQWLCRSTSRMGSYDYA